MNESLAARFRRMRSAATCDSRAAVGRQSDDSGATVERQSGDWRVAAGERTTRVRLKV